ncbi:MAG: PorV/PorQ family protein [Elusimicrobiota bacterium]
MRINYLKVFLTCGFIFQIVFFLSIPLNAAAGTSTATFLKITPGARPAGMGEAFSAVADDINSLYLNPAGLVNIKRKEISVMKNQWFTDITHFFGGIALPFQNDTLGFGLNNLYISGIEIYDRGNLTGINASDISFDFSYAHKVTGKLNIGTNIKYISQQIGEILRGDTAAMGFGLQYKAIKNIRISLAALNLGSIRFTTRGFRGNEEPLPFTYKAGAAFYLIEDNVILSTELENDVDDIAKIKTGIEIKLFGSLLLRAGHKAGVDLGKTTLGAGLKTNWLAIDYAFVNYGELGNTSRISTIFRFGKTIKDEEIGTKIKKTNVAVSDFAGKNISSTYASTVSDLIRTELVNTNVFNILDRSNMETLLAEQKFQMVGCTDKECAIKMGKLLNVEQIVVGTFSRIEDMYYITANLIEVETGKIIKSVSTKITALEELSETAGEVVQKLTEDYK